MGTCRGGELAVEAGDREEELVGWAGERALVGGDDNDVLVVGVTD